MNSCLENVENNENVANDCVTVTCTNNDVKDISTSQDLFSDDDQIREAAFLSPKHSVNNDTINSSIVSLKTPILCSKVTEVTPGRAVVPRTPVDLLPFITKTSVLWTSDMETPDGKLNDKTENHDITINSEIETNNTTPNSNQQSPNSDVKMNKMNIVSSPVLGSKKRVKRKVKRRILNNIALDTDNNSDQQSISSNSDKVPSEGSSVNNDPFFDIKPEMKLNIIEEISKSNNKECKENKKLEEAVVFDKNSNTSTQDFFSNVSFSSIDRLCINVSPKQKLGSIPESENEEKNNHVVIKQENTDQGIIKPNISNDILERVAAIKRNQKPLRRSIDINHTIIPKEEFSKSIRELELADAKFSQEKKKISKAQPKPLRLMTFSELTSTDNSKSIQKEVTPEKENHDVPTEIMDDWNTEVFTNTNFNVYEKTSANAKISSSAKLEMGFCSAGGKEIAINEKNLKKCMRMYEEIEKEISSNNDLLSVEKSSTKSNLLIQPTKQLSRSPNMISNKVNFKLSNQTDVKCTISKDEFSTASGKNILISEDKILNYAKIYNDLENENLNENNLLEFKNKISKPSSLELDFRKNKSMKTKTVTNTKIEDNKAAGSNIKHSNEKKTDMIKICKELDVKEFLEPKVPRLNELNINDGFATAGGRGIQINEQKERLYEKIYKELDNDDANNLQNVKKDNALKQITVAKPTDKAIIKFNKKVNDSDLPGIVKTFPICKNLGTETLEFSKGESASNGFSTARGKGIKISEEKEMMYTKIYNELGDNEESNLINLNQKSLKQVVENPKSKALIVFKDKSKNTCNNLVTVTNKTNVVQQNTIVTSDGFSTARGKDIKVNIEKENYYSKIFNELSEDIQDENSFFNKTKKELPTVVGNANNNKVKIAFNQKKTVPVASTTKISKSNNSNALKNLANVEIIANHISNSTNDLNKMSETATDLKKVSYTEKENVQINKPNAAIETHLKEKKSTHLDIPVNRHLCKLKLKLENCEEKRTERCRSFGGFPRSSNETVSSIKLNKSDPYNDSANQPLQKGLSVSQHFDLHSDSWLSKIELNDLNASKAKSPEVERKSDRMEQEISTAPNDFLGFSYKECTESFKLYASFEKFLKRHIRRFKLIRELSIESGQTITISNHARSRQTLSIHCDCEADVRSGMMDSNYILFDSPDKSAFKLPETSEVKTKDNECKEMKAGNKIVEKRKHADTDSDTPLTTLKKPRTGSELQGRRLFSDDSDADEEEGEKQETNNVRDNLIQNLPLTPPQPVNLTEEELAELTEMRMDAIMQQEKMIRNKKRIDVKPIVGSLLRERIENSKKRKSWADYVGSSVPMIRPIQQIKQNHPDAKILEVNASNAMHYKFLSSNFVDNKRVVSLQLEDNVRLIFDEEGHAGFTEFSDALTAMPGVDPKLLPMGWIQNHYRWIVWKLASIDRIRFEKTELPKMLTPSRVMKELKYRYDREIDRAQRPALRRILEKDDVPSRRMVLCVSSIVDIPTSDNTDKDVKTMLGLPRFKIEVTDGWYSIPLTIDNAISNYILSRKIKEGTKLMTYGAILLECERGVFPLDKPANVSLKIFTNCTRRVRWDTKLGYQKSQGPIPVKLRNIILSGGMVGETTAVAARVYPLLYREKTPDGQSIYRNARSEEKAAVAYERALEKKVDAMYAQAEKNFDSNKKLDFNDDLENTQTESTSQIRTRGQRSWERKREELKQRLESEVRQGLPPPRNVTPVLKVRLLDDRTSVILTIWGANEESGYDIKEGNTVTVYNSYAMGSRGGEMNLTANRLTHIKPEPLLKLPYPMRFCTLIPDIASMSFDPKFCEFDTIGVVVSTGPAPHGMKNFEVVNMAYPKPNNSGSSYLSVLFWNGVSSFGYQGTFSVGALISCTNLEWRRNTSWHVAVAYCSERTVFTCNPRQQYLNTGLRNLRALIQNPVTYAESCVEDVMSELSKKPLPRSNQNTPTSWPTDRSHNSSSFVSPMEGHTPGHVSIQKRLEKLSRYGSSADISPIVLNSGSKRVKKEYTPVGRKNT